MRSLIYIRAIRVARVYHGLKLCQSSKLYSMFHQDPENIHSQVLLLSKSVYELLHMEGVIVIRNPQPCLQPRAKKLPHALAKPHSILSNEDRFLHSTTYLPMLSFLIGKKNYEDFLGIIYSGSFIFLRNPAIRRIRNQLR